MKLMRTLIILSATLIQLLTAGTAFSQKSGTATAYDSLSLKDLLEVKVVSVSKSSEFLFDAPLSASVITKEEIKRSGSTSIMEALRLIPGLVVREQSNGNYDIALRGLDNIPPNASFDIISATTLVMINNRPIYSYLRGGTFWETLSIDINDVEKIEVVRGPAAALYGPNAVNGVINIITRQLRKEGFYFQTNNQHGSFRTFVHNASVGYKGKKFSFIGSGNFQHRNRTQTSYFEYNRNRWIDNPDYFVNFKDDTVRNIDTRYPNRSLAMKKYGANVFINYDIAKDVNLDLTAGLQNSIVQKVSAENENTPLSTASSISKYLDIRAKVKSFNSQISFNKGTQNVDYDPGNKFDFSTFDANLEYNYSAGKLLLKPAVSYRRAIYDDRDYSDTAKKAGIFNTRGEITTLSGSLRGEYRLLDERLRVVTGLAANKFNYPDETYLSYQLAATFKINNRNLIRGVISRAPRSSNIFETYVNQTVAFFPIGYQKYQHMILKGNKALELFTANLREIGYRGKISSKWNVDVELFHINARNASVQVTSKPSMELRGSDTVFVVPIVSTNLPLKVNQNGITITLNYTSRRIQFKPFITWQHTDVKDYAPYPNTPDAGNPAGNIYSGIGTTSHLNSTPGVFGGAYLNYAVNTRFSISMNNYFTSSQRYYHLSNVLFNDGVRGRDHLLSKALVNLSFSYQPMKELRIFLSGKNIFNNQTREFFGTDKTPFMLLGGFSYEF